MIVAVKGEAKSRFQKFTFLKLPLSYIRGTLYVTGIKRLEDEEKERELAGVPQTSAAARALKVVIRIQSSANRCVWFSSTELSVYIQTGNTFWTTHADQPLFLARLHFMLHECVRILEDRSPGILEPAQVPIQVIGFARRESSAQIQSPSDHAIPLVESSRIVVDVSTTEGDEEAASRNVSAGRDDACPLHAPHVTDEIHMPSSATKTKNDSAIPPLVSSGTSLPDDVDQIDPEDLFGDLDLLPAKNDSAIPPLVSSGTCLPDDVDQID